MDTRTTFTADWRAAVWTAFKAGLLTRAARDVLLTLATFRGPGGRLWPSHERLASRASCCVRTVVRAMAQAREAGLLTWRPIRWQTPAGFWRQKSNVYALRLPASAPKGLSDPEGEQKKIKKKEEGSGGKSVAQQLAALAVFSVVDARAALAQVAERMLERQRANRAAMPDEFG